MAKSSNSTIDRNPFVSNMIEVAQRARRRLATLGESEPIQDLIWEVDRFIDFMQTAQETTPKKLLRELRQRGNAGILVAQFKAYQTYYYETHGIASTIKEPGSREEKEAILFFNRLLRAQHNRMSPRGDFLIIDPAPEPLYARVTRFKIDSTRQEGETIVPGTTADVTSILFNPYRAAFEIRGNPPEDHPNDCTPYKLYV